MNLNLQKLITERFKTYENMKIGYNLEENMRELLKVKFNYEEANIPREFCFRKVFKESGGAYIIKKDVSCSLISKGETKAILQFNENDNSCYVLNPDGKRIIKEIYENEKNTQLKELGVTVSSLKKIEMDGIYLLEKFIMPEFKANEVKLFFNGINIDSQEEKNVCVIIEVKKNKAKLKELIQQIKFDYSIMDKVLDGTIIYLGFIGDGTEDRDLDEKIDLNAELEDINCAIFEIKKDTIFGKKIKEFIDWDTVKNIELIKRRLDDLEIKFDEIIKFIRGKDEKKKKNNKKLGKKRRREN